MNVRKVNYGDPSAPSEFTKSLKQTGFGVLSDHPIDKNLIDNVYKEWSDFFNSENKSRYLYNEVEQDGYFPFQTENAKGQTLKDLKEFYHIYPWGKYPKEVSDTTRILFDQLLELTSTLLEWIQDQTPIDIASKFSMPLNSK